MAATPGFLPRAEPCPPRYRPRTPRATSLYQLLEAHYETVKGLWEERFEQRYGFWRGFYDTAVARYYDCGLFESGFARVKCTACPNEFLVAFSCKGRGLCPSCGAKRAAIFSELLQNE
ncbi:MAG: transposase zinc-binding domain-containing protein, partial [Candidatus Krumholzibacteriia bacterium]